MEQLLGRELLTNNFPFSRRLGKSMCNLFKTKCIHVLNHSETHRIMQSNVRILWNKKILLNLNNNFDWLIQITKSYCLIEISMLLILRFGKEISHTYVFVKRSFPQQMIHTNRHWYWGRSTCWNKKFYFVLSCWIFDVSRRSTRVINAEERISCCCINFRYYWMSANNRD
jgi:hypothetical protein